MHYACTYDTCGMVHKVRMRRVSMMHVGVMDVKKRDEQTDEHTFSGSSSRSLIADYSRFWITLQCNIQYYIALSYITLHLLSYIELHALSYIKLSCEQ